VIFEKNLLSNAWPFTSKTARPKSAWGGNPTLLWIRIFEGQACCLPTVSRVNRCRGGCNWRAPARGSGFIFTLA